MIVNRVSWRRHKSFDRISSSPFRLMVTLAKVAVFPFLKEASVLSGHHHVQHSASAIQFKVQWNSYSHLMPELP